MSVGSTRCVSRCGESHTTPNLPQEVERVFRRFPLREERGSDVSRGEERDVARRIKILSRRIQLRPGKPMPSGKRTATNDRDTLSNDKRLERVNEENVTLVIVPALQDSRRAYRSRPMYVFRKQSWNYGNHRILNSSRVRPSETTKAEAGVSLATVSRGCKTLGVTTACR